MGRIVSIALGCFLFIMLSSISQATEKEAVALISSLKGKVEVQRAGQGTLRAVHLGEELFKDDVVYTYKNSRASLFFSDGSVITVYPNSRLVLSLREMDKQEGGSLVASLSKEVMKGMREIFSPAKKRETLTAVPGIRKKIEEEEKGIRVLYPRNSMISSSKPSFRWKTQGSGQIFMVSLMLKGMGGQIWTMNTEETEISYPEGKRGLDRGKTYFLRVESEEDSSLYDEVYFRVLDEEMVEEVRRFENKMEDLRKSNPGDKTPTFILAGYYKGKGLYHEALGEFEALERVTPGERFILEGKREVYAKLGFWKKWEEVNKKLVAMK